MSEGVVFEDYYDLLGVDSDASREEILRAYREQVRRHHPDVADRRAGADADTGETARRFKHLSRAREVLSTPARRAEYDRLGHASYVARYDGTDPLQPGAGRGDDRPATRPDRERTGSESDGQESTPAGRRAGGPPREGVDAGAVVEGDDGTDLQDLVGHDPVERAWRRFRRLWIVRAPAVVALVAGATALSGSGPARALAVATVGTALVVGATGVHAVATLDRRADPTPPPESASVGLLAPVTVRRARRHARRWLALAAVLVGVGTLTPGHPLGTLVSGSSGAWLPAGGVGAPKLAAALSAGATAALGGSLLAGTLAAILAVAGGAWLARHAGYDAGRPYLWEGLAVAAAGAIALGVATTAETYPGTVPAGGRWLGAAGTAPTGATVALAGLATLAALVGLSGRVHREAVLGSQSRSTRTDATTS